MAEYIEKTEELILAVNAGARAIENTKKYHGATYCMDAFSDNPKEIPYLKAAEVLREFDGIPAADVQTVVHGEWMDCENYNDIEECSVCGVIYRYPSFYRYNYCPNCGARMDGE